MIDVKTLCLGVLSRGDASGYEIRKEFEDGTLSHFSDAGFGSIYPALKRLLDDGQIVLLPQGGDTRPDKKVYRITPAGRATLYEALMRQPGPDKLRSDLMFTLYFSGQLPTRHLDKIIRDRIEQCRQQIAAIERCDDRHGGAGEKFVDGLSKALYRAAAAYLEENRHALLESVHRESKVAE